MMYFIPTWASILLILTITLPSSLKEILHLQNNKLEGQIPESLSDLENLDEFLFQNNADIEGRVPNQMCDLDLSLIMADCHIRCNCCDDDCDRDIRDIWGHPVFQFIKKKLSTTQ